MPIVAPALCSGPNVLCAVQEVQTAIAQTAVAPGTARYDSDRLLWSTAAVAVSVLCASGPIELWATGGRRWIYAINVGLLCNRYQNTRCC